jgi:two-component system chemotaxis response regulator CheY
MSIRRILENLGFEIEEAENGEHAWELLTSGEPFDIAMVDWNMPVMNGYEFIQKVRTDASYADLQLVMVTTENESSQVVKALTAGANEYIMKPFTDEMIAEKIEMLGLL